MHSMFCFLLDVKEFDKFNFPPDIETVWWNNFEKSCSISNSMGTKFRTTKAVCWSGLTKIPIGTTGVTLSGRADRLDVLPDKTVEILDFKTGTPPSSKQVRELLFPQLVLEAALLMEGAFPDFQDLTPQIYFTFPWTEKVKLNLNLFF